MKELALIASAVAIVLALLTLAAQRRLSRELRQAEEQVRRMHEALDAMEKARLRAKQQRQFAREEYEHTLRERAGIARQVPSGVQQAGNGYLELP